ncbi:oxidoreductase ucpA [Trematosphaeria pertusa]|uniref:Oxidoreductase ucpA n=1 Tax=Trematosphaeria pertusa TaxID=390896 RepID=A0A6A6I1H1_9PLEO|nr:oxidoreductase ucpA [Trematosphaeria pertusa]KAF2244171.1 oxidoreductase ucpA [Trematosphaeria pertusa]
MEATKVALVTAGSAGLGAAIARCLAIDAKMNVIINYSSNTQRAEALVKELQGNCPSQKFAALQADIGDRTQVEGLVEQALSSMGRLDVVVSNAGWTRMTDFMDLDEGVTDEDWDRCFTINVKSHLWLMKAAKKHLDDTEGVFITTASVAGVKPSGSSLPYAVSKAAQIHLVKSLAIIAAPKVRVNSVSPGVLLTEWGRKFPEERLRAVQKASKLERFATVEDVAEQVKIFALSKSVTGQNAVVDAGFSLSI